MPIRIWRIAPLRDKPGIQEIGLSPAYQTLNAVTQRLPDGAYTTFRTYAGRRVLHLEKQLERLKTTASLVNRPIEIGESVFRDVLRTAIRSFPGEVELRFRVTVDLEEIPGTIYVAVEELVVPTPEQYAAGVKTMTCEMERKNPKAKLTRFINRADIVRQAMPEDIHEALMVNQHGQILEGLSSNFFAVQDMQLYTEDETVLSGITRELVLDCARQAGLVTIYSPIRVADVALIDEAFITSASRGVLPICKVDRYVIGGDCPGYVTRLLTRLYDARISHDAKPV